MTQHFIDLKVCTQIPSDISSSLVCSTLCSIVVLHFTGLCMLHRQQAEVNTFPPEEFSCPIVYMNNGSDTQCFSPQVGRVLSIFPSNEDELSSDGGAGGAVRCSSVYKPPAAPLLLISASHPFSSAGLVSFTDAFFFNSSNANKNVSCTVAVQSHLTMN